MSDDDDAIPKDNPWSQPGEIPQPFRPHLVAETGGALRGDIAQHGKAEDIGQAKSEDNREIWVSSTGRIAVQQAEKVMNKSAAKTPLQLLILFGWVVFFGFLVSACGLAVVVPFKLTMGWMGL